MEKAYLLYGFGTSLLSLAKYLHKHGQSFYIFDNSHETLNHVKEFNIFNENLWGKIGTLVVSPGICVSKNKLCLKAKELDIPITNDVQMFVDLCPINSNFAFTGTFGKSTAVALFQHLYSKLVGSIQIAGNFGIPCFECDPQKTTVFELSAQQLSECGELRVKFACILNIYSQHLDYFNSMKNYFQSKLKILNNAEIRLISDEIPYMPYLSCKIMSLNNIGADYYYNNKEVYENGNKIANVDIKNIAPISFLAAYAAMRLIGQDASKIIAELDSFETLDHRCEVFKINKKTIVNDSKSTNLQNTAHCVNKFYKDHSRIALICGGKYAEQELSILDDILNKITFVSTTGASGKILCDYFTSKNVQCTFNDSLQDCIKDCYEYDTILFSPGYASTDEYKNFEERGNVFKQMIFEYNKKL
jgi:UDP-N-acetylmuramoylalanine--D-glutamate ligase